MSDPASAAIRFALYVDLMLLFGLPMFGLYALRGAERMSGAVLPFRQILIGLAFGGIGLSAVAVILLAASMSGVAPSAVDSEAIDAVVNGTSIGMAWKVRVAALLFVLVLSLVVGRRPRTGLAMTAAGAMAALASLAWTGHGAASDGVRGWVHLAGDIVHLLAAGVWLGAIFAFALLLFRRSSEMSTEHVQLSHRTLHGFSKAGSAVVGLIIISGITNSWILIGPENVGGLFSSLYGQLLMIKLALFAAMIVLAWANRYRLTPAIAAAVDSGAALCPAVRALRRSLVLEAGAALVILALVAWLGLLAPPTIVM